MKKVFILPLLLIVSLTGCKNKNTSSNTNTNTESTSREIPTEAKVNVKFYIDYAHIEEPLLSYKWYENKVLEEFPEIGPEDCPDPAYPTFLGWSTHPVVDDESYIWNMSEDYPVMGTRNLNFYGIWVCDDPSGGNPVDPDQDTLKVYFAKPDSWNSTMYAYAWSDDAHHNYDWPGSTMSQVEGKEWLYSYEVSLEYTSIIFGDGTHQTTDISLAQASETNPYYDGSKWTTIPDTKPEEPVQEFEYYLVGKINGVTNWTSTQEQYGFTPNASNKGEYYIKDIELKSGDEFKAIKVVTGGWDWYPSGDNYKVTASGTYDIYFKPAGSSDWGGVFYLAKK